MASGPWGAGMIERRFLEGCNLAEVTFCLPYAPDSGRVAVVGDFNSWDPSATRMHRQGPLLTATVAIETGRRYSFLYLSEDGGWVNDPAADAYVGNKFGSRNGILDLRP